MKHHCQSCGCHFPEDFSETLEPDCTWWKNLGFPDDFPEKYKLIIWDAMNIIPFDEIGDVTGCLMTPYYAKVTSIRKRTDEESGSKMGNDFDDKVPGYKDWDDDKRRRFQKAWFKLYYDRRFVSRAWDQVMMGFSLDWCGRDELEQAMPDVPERDAGSEPGDEISSQS